MIDDELKSNSNALKNKPAITPITTKVTVKNDSESQKMKKRFFAEDIKTVGGHVLDTVLIPSIQKIISDLVKNGIDFLIYGSKSNRSQSGVGNISYMNYYNRGVPNVNYSYTTPMLGTNKSNVYTVNDIVFNGGVEARGEAEEVLLRMKEYVDVYGMVSVADFYELIGSKSDHTDQKWGWRDLRNAEVIRVDNGFAIRFPRIQPLE